MVTVKYRNAHAMAESVQIKYMVFCELNMPPSKEPTLYRYLETTQAQNTDIPTRIIREQESPVGVIGDIDIDGYFWIIPPQGADR